MSRETRRYVSRRTVVLGAAGATAAAAVPGSLAWASAAEGSAPSGGRPVGLQGVYRWAVPNGPSHVTEFAQWLGRRTVWGLEFMAVSTWDQLAGDDWINPDGTLWSLTGWSDWVRQQPSRNLVLSVGMLPGPANLSGPTTGSGAGQPVSLARGAAGDYDGYFRRLAERLVALKLQRTWIRVGWEFDGFWYAWRASSDPAHWVEYWRRIVTVMKSVPGAAFKFIWNPNIGMQQTDATTMYPGDAYVDLIAVDAYDQSWLSGTYPIPSDADELTATAIRERVWKEDLYGGPRGLAFWADFSRLRRLPLALGEWGVTIRPDRHGGGDNPGYIRHMYEFITDNPHVIFNCYFDVNAADGAHQLSPGLNSRNNPVPQYFPESAEVFRTLFGPQAKG